MSKINRLLLMLIAMVVIMIAAVGIDKGIKYFDAQKWEKERVERYEEAYAEVSDIQVTISELSQDQEAIEEFIEENKEYFEEIEFNDAEALSRDLEAVQEEAGPEGELLENLPDENISENTLPEEAVSENTLEGSVSDNAVSENTLSDNTATESVSDNTVTEGTSEDTVSDNTVSENQMQNTVPEEATTESVSENALTETVSENALEGSVSGNTLEGSVSENTVSGNVLQETVSQNTVSANNLSENSAGDTVSGNALADAELTLQERRELNSSYIETQNINQRDKQIIAESAIDFSQITISCLGDSITEATNLDKMENYRQYSYPSKLGHILGAEAVHNFGIGGSSIGRYWENAFVDRYKEIPRDTDIIIVMGGTNDGFCITKDELGTIQERKPRTFIGDLDELMKGLKAEYPDALIVFATPLPNVLHDMLRKERDYLLPQKEIVDSIKLLAQENSIPVIDLYNANLLDSHDAAVIFNYMPDGVHGNEQGYQILAEHMAAELIQIYSGKE